MNGTQPMKAISLWQPWASLLAIMAKIYETRSWETRYRGPIAIHAALKKPPMQGDLPYEVFDAMVHALSAYYGAWRYDWHLGGTRMNPDGTDNGFDIPRGAVIATAELVGCHKMYETPTGVLIQPGEPKRGRFITGDELLFGDWTPGRYAWEFANMQLLPVPIPARGMQGLWNWEREAA